MSFRLVPKSVTLNDLERRNDPYFSLFLHTNSVASGAHCVKRVKVVEDVAVKKLTFAISSPGEFLVFLVFLINLSVFLFRAAD